MSSETLTLKLCYISKTDSGWWVDPKAPAFDGWQLLTLTHTHGEHNDTLKTLVHLNLNGNGHVSIGSSTAVKHRDFNSVQYSPYCDVWAGVVVRWDCSCGIADRLQAAVYWREVGACWKSLANSTEYPAHTAGVEWNALFWSQKCCLSP